MLFTRCEPDGFVLLQLSPEIQGLTGRCSIMTNTLEDGISRGPSITQSAGATRGTHGHRGVQVPVCRSETHYLISIKSCFLFNQAGSDSQEKQLEATTCSLVSR